MHCRARTEAAFLVTLGGSAGAMFQTTRKASNLMLAKRLDNAPWLRVPISQQNRKVPACNSPSRASMTPGFKRAFPLQVTGLEFNGAIIQIPFKSWFSHVLAVRP